MNILNTFRFPALPYVAVVFLVLITGCGSTGRQYQERAEQPLNTPQIVIFRPDDFFQGGIPYQVNLDNKEVAILRNGGYVVVNTSPGVSVVEIRAASAIQALFRNPTLSVRSTDKERVFLRVTPARGNTVHLKVVPEAEAIPELKTLRLSE